MEKYFYIIVTLIVFSLFILFKMKIEAKIQNKWTKEIIEYGFILFIIPICVSLILPFFQRKEREREEIFKSEIIGAIINDKTNISQLNELMVLKYKEIFKSSKNEAKAWAEDFLSSVDLKRREIRELDVHEEELSNKLILKWMPLFQFIVSDFDARINSLKEKQEGITYEKSKLALLQNSKLHNSNRKAIRKVIFPNGGGITVVVRTAKIEKGILMYGPQILFYENPVSGSTETAFYVDWSHVVQLNPGNKHYESIDYRTKEDPLLDIKFKSKLFEGINQIITSSYLSE